MILDVTCSLGGSVLKEKSVFSIVIMAAAFAATFFFNVNVIYIILTAGLLGAGKAVWIYRKGKSA